MSAVVFFVREIPVFRQNVLLALEHSRSIEHKPSLSCVAAKNVYTFHHVLPRRCSWKSARKCNSSLFVVHCDPIDRIVSDEMPQTKLSLTASAKSLDRSRERKEFAPVDKIRTSVAKVSRRMPSRGIDRAGIDQIPRRVVTDSWLPDFRVERRPLVPNCWRMRHYLLPLGVPWKLGIFPFEKRLRGT